MTLGERVAKLEEIAKANQGALQEMGEDLKDLVEWKNEFSGTLKAWRWLAPIGTAIAIGMASKWIGI